MKQQVCVLGDGAWGTAVATLLAHNGHQVTLWCHNADVAQTIQRTRYNERYLPGVKLDALIYSTTDMREALTGAQWVFEAIPVKFLRSIVEQAKPFSTPDQVWIVLSKGIESDTHLLPASVIDAVFSYTVPKAIFSGPSFAHDLACQKITAGALAAVDSSIAHELHKLLANEYFRPYLTSDVVGVQVGGALKNVITLGIGMLDGAGYTDNTKAFILTRGLDEMVHLAVALGGERETVYGLSGVGDLVLTATGGLSKNLAAGRHLGAGTTVAQLEQQWGNLPEGVNTVVSVNQLAHKLNLKLPLCQGIYRVMFENYTLDQLLAELVGTTDTIRG